MMYLLKSVFIIKSYQTIIMFGEHDLFKGIILAWELLKKHENPQSG